MEMESESGVAANQHFFMPDGQDQLSIHIECLDSCTPYRSDSNKIYTFPTEVILPMLLAGIEYFDFLFILWIVCSLACSFA